MGYYNNDLVLEQAAEIEKLKGQLATSQQREAELQAHVERLREALEYALSAWQYDGICDEHGSVFAEADARRKATPAQSLARLRNQVRGACAEACEQVRQNRIDIIARAAAGMCLDEILAMKEPE